MVLRSPAFVGRGDELAAVRQAVTAAGGGAGRLVLVLGEAGIGKSRLIAEATRLAADLRMPVLTGQAVEDSGPYRPVAEALLGGLRAGTPDLDELRRGHRFPGVAAATAGCRRGYAPSG
jgi:predicted ATPase